MRYARLKERLHRRETIILDGPMGTELQRRGVAMQRLVTPSTSSLNLDF
jgi:S-methylmethionine-dependent homocysteine/selenocysteine methylase